MRFFALHEGLYEGVQNRLDQFEAACKTLSVEFIPLDSQKLNHAALPSLGNGDLLYNVSRGSSFTEFSLLSNDVTTFYVETPRLPLANTDTVQYAALHAKLDIPQPKTIFHLTANRDLLKSYVDYLGGFPIIIKAAGSSRGIGVMKVDSMASLFSVADYLLKVGGEFILRQYLRGDAVGRCRVLGNRVIQMYDFPLLGSDFRTACLPLSDLPPVFARDYSTDIQQLCVRASHLANFQFAAVDFMLDSSSSALLLEVNCPAGMPPHWRESGNRVALEAVSFLKAKALGV
jgi:glutathione synthase/RimK-type ligase-like ATP-grasp enzyme